MPLPPAARSCLAIGSLSVLCACSDGSVDGNLVFQLNADNIAYFQDVFYPRDRAGTWSQIFAPRGAYAVLDVPYQTTEVSALVTQTGDLQITAHLTLGRALKALDREDETRDAFSYLEEPAYNADLGVDDEGNSLTVGEDLLAELTADPDPGYRGLDEDIRVVVLLNLPDDTDVLQERWSPETEDNYPKELVANYGATDEDGYHCSEDQVQIAAFVLAGQERFDADFAAAADNACAPGTDHVDLVLDRFVHPDWQAGLGDPSTRGHLSLALTDAALAAVGGVASLELDLDVIADFDPWSLDQPEAETPEPGSDL